MGWKDGRTIWPDSVVTICIPKFLRVHNEENRHTTMYILYNLRLLISHLGTLFNKIFTTSILYRTKNSNQLHHS